MRQIRSFIWTGDCWDAVRLDYKLPYRPRYFSIQYPTLVAAFINVIVYDHEGD